MGLNMCTYYDGKTVITAENMNAIQKAICDLERNAQGGDIWRYNSLADIGLTGAVTMTEVMAAMPTNSELVMENNTGLANNVSDAPGVAGVLTVIRLSTFAEASWAQTSAEAPTRYWGTWDATNGWTGWQEFGGETPGGEDEPVEGTVTWSQVTDKPFGDEKNVNITWDGDTTGRLLFSQLSVYLVSPETPGAYDLLGAALKVTLAGVEQHYTIGAIFDADFNLLAGDENANAVILLPGLDGVFVILSEASSDNPVWVFTRAGDIDGIQVPAAGIYSPRVEDTSSGSAVYSYMSGLQYSTAGKIGTEWLEEEIANLPGQVADLSATVGDIGTVLDSISGEVV